MHKFQIQGQLGQFQLLQKLQYIGYQTKEKVQHIGVYQQGSHLPRITKKIYILIACPSGPSGPSGPTIHFLFFYVPKLNPYNI